MIFQLVPSYVLHVQTLCAFGSSFYSDLGWKVYNELNLLTHIWPLIFSARKGAGSDLLPVSLLASLRLPAPRSRHAVGRAFHMEDAKPLMGQTLPRPRKQISLQANLR